MLFCTHININSLIGVSLYSWFWNTHTDGDKYSNLLKLNLKSLFPDGLSIAQKKLDSKTLYEHYDYHRGCENILVEVSKCGRRNLEDEIWKVQL